MRKTKNDSIKDKGQAKLSLTDIQIMQSNRDFQLLSQQNLKTQLTHLELLSPSQSETKEKLPFSGFYGNSTQEHFFLAIYGSPDSAMNLVRETQSESRVQFWERVQ